MHAAPRVASRPVTVLERLLDDPCPFGLGEAIRTIGLLTGRDDPLGTGLGDAAARVLAARQFAAAGSEVERVERASDGTFDVYTRALNLAGAGGTLPDALDRAVFDPGGCDGVVLAALDRWTHHAVSAWYRVWAAHPFCRAAAGLPASAEALFRRPRTCAGLARVAAWAADAPAVVHAAIGDWDGAGGRVEFSRAGRCRIVIGPVDRQRAEELRSDGPVLRGLLQLADSYADGMVGFDVVVRLAGRDIPPARWSDPAARFDETCLSTVDPDGQVIIAVGQARCDALAGGDGWPA